MAGEREKQEERKRASGETGKKLMADELLS
jgi:hypothetical protein